VDFSEQSNLREVPVHVSAATQNDEGGIPSRTNKAISNFTQLVKRGA